MENTIRQCRRDAGLSQEQLAVRLGVTRQTIISIERGRFDPSLNLAFRLAALFDAPIENLFMPDADK